MKFEISQHGEGADVTLAIVGELDMSTIPQLSERVSELLTGGVAGVTLDLHDLAFMDSSGLRLLIELYDRSRLEGWDLRLISPKHEAAALVLRATGADTALPFQKAGGQ